MLLPKRTKFRKVHRGRMKGVSSANTVVFGEYGLQALEPVWLTSRQIEATRRSITRYVRKTGKIWIRVFPDTLSASKREGSPYRTATNPSTSLPTPHPLTSLAPLALYLPAAPTEYVIHL